MEINIFYKSIRECIEDKLKKGDSLNMSFRIDSAIDSNKSNLDSKKLDEQKEVKPKIEVFGQKKYKEVYTKSGENQLAILVEDNSSSPYEFLNKLQENLFTLQLWLNMLNLFATILLDKVQLLELQLLNYIAIYQEIGIW